MFYRSWRIGTILYKYFISIHAFLFYITNFSYIYNLWKYVTKSGFSKHYTETKHIGYLIRCIGICPGLKNKLKITTLYFTVALQWDEVWFLWRQDWHLWYNLLHWRGQNHPHSSKARYEDGSYLACPLHGCLSVHVLKREQRNNLSSMSSTWLSFSSCPMKRTKKFKMCQQSTNYY